MQQPIGVVGLVINVNDVNVWTLDSCIRMGKMEILQIPKEFKRVAKVS